mgnify:CR=1 FL=1
MYSEKQQAELQKLTTHLLTSKPISFQDILAAAAVVTELHQVLKYHDWRYYVLAEPVLKDIDYDHLFDYLKGIEKEQPSLLKADSPTQRVARGLSTDFPSVAHTIPMLSLAKAYNETDLRDWDTSVKKLLEEEEIEINEEGILMSENKDVTVHVTGVSMSGGVKNDDKRSAKCCRV